jgi:phosphodiesterase/alkaline phosphatase D-like protein
VKLSRIRLIATVALTGGLALTLAAGVGSVQAVSATRTTTPFRHGVINPRATAEATVSVPARTPAFDTPRI